jgi:hypothetical protein
MFYEFTLSLTLMTEAGGRIDAHSSNSTKFPVGHHPALPTF